MASSSTTIRAEAFIARALSVHNGKYDYRLVASSYRSAHEKATIICPLHGPFQQAPASHTKGQGCPHCGGRVGASTEARRDRFIAGAHARHGHRYIYDAVVFIDQRTPVEIRCYEHGSFQQRPTNHINGSGCPSCATGCIPRALHDKKVVAITTTTHDNRCRYECCSARRANSNAAVSRAGYGPKLRRPGSCAVKPLSFSSMRPIQPSAVSTASTERQTSQSRPERPTLKTVGCMGTAVASMGALLAYSRPYGAACRLHRAMRRGGQTPPSDATFACFPPLAGGRRQTTAGERARCSTRHRNLPRQSCSRQGDCPEFNLGTRVDGAASGDRHSI